MHRGVFEQLPDVLIPWYAENKRNLPWRETSDPYRIWVSEIMLQQTRVEAVKGYYGRFLAQLPTVDELAKVDDDLLNKLWEGLGYYSRARNMKKAARVIMAKYNGVFPREYPEVIDLPGVGPYTAGAICSIAFGLKTPAVDGNVLRVVARLTNDFTPIDKAEFKKQAHESLLAIYPDEAGAFTQAIMEIGATVCGPNRKPVCDLCPCRGFCMAYHAGTAEQLPVKSPKRSRRTEEKTIFILCCGDHYALEKRPQKGLLAGLWQFPNVPEKLDIDGAISAAEAMGVHVRDVSRVVQRKHIFTHVQWNMTGVYLEVTEQGGSFTWMTKEQINTEASIPTAFKLFWDELENV